MRDSFTQSYRCRALLFFLVLFTAGCGSNTYFVPRTTFVGDSITALWDQSYSGQVDAFVLNDWIDVGIGGVSSAQILSELKENLTDKPTVVHIIAGTNDVYPGWQLSNTTGNIENMVSIARQNHMLVAIGTIPPWGPGPVSEQADPSEARFQRISELNAWIIQYGAAQKIPIIDYHAALEATNGQNYAPGLTYDGVHPSAAGYAVMTPLAEKAIEGLLSKFRR